MPRLFLLSIICFSSVVNAEIKERQTRNLGGVGGAGGSNGESGMPGGNGGGSGGVGGIGGGNPGIPGGVSIEDDFGLTLEDIHTIFGRPHVDKPVNHSGPVGKPKIKIGPECDDVDGIQEMVNSPKYQKKAWLAFLIKLVENGKKACAEELSQQLLVLENKLKQN